MSEKKIIRTALDPTPAAVSRNKSPEDYDWKNDPTVVRKMELGKPAIEAYFRQYGHLENSNEETK